MFEQFCEISILKKFSYNGTYRIKMYVNYNGNFLYATRTITTFELDCYNTQADFKNRIHIKLKEAVISQAKFLGIYSEYKPSNWLKEGF